MDALQQVAVALHGRPPQDSINIEELRRVLNGIEVAFHAETSALVSSIAERDNRILVLNAENANAKVDIMTLQSKVATAQAKTRDLDKVIQTLKTDTAQSLAREHQKLKESEADSNDRGEVILKQDRLIFNLEDKVNALREDYIEISSRSGREKQLLDAELQRHRMELQRKDGVIAELKTELAAEQKETSSLKQMVKLERERNARLDEKLESALAQNIQQKYAATSKLKPGPQMTPPMTPAPPAKKQFA